MKSEKGYALIHNKAINKSTAFTMNERKDLSLRGLLPYGVSDIKTQQHRVMTNLRRKEKDIEKYIYLTALEDRNERLFYRTVIDYFEEIMPLIYTPTVGQACNEFATIFSKPKGFYINPEDKGEIAKILDNWPESDVRVIVITDGQRILGLGDLGANGMGIAIGKLALYVSCAGIHPHQCLPVMFDVGTNNETLLESPLYLGYRHNRLERKQYIDLMKEFITAVQIKFPKALIQFEDFHATNAFALLNEYRNKVLCFNDDIQGTAAVVLAGIYASTRITRDKFTDLRIMFLGAGTASTGIGDLIVSALVKEGLSETQARRRLWFLNRKGLVVKSRNDLEAHNLPYAHDNKQLDLVNAIKSIKPHVLIGASGAPQTFTQEVIEAMSECNARPVIFALSNPTSKAECTANQAYMWSNGSAIFSSGSPFEPVDYGGRLFQPGQGNNAYIFPGLGLGALACEASTINDEMLRSSALTLAKLVSQESLNSGSLYPPLREIRKVSLEIACAVASTAYELGLAQNKKPENLKSHIASMMYEPTY